jgi:hypothetical protein
LISCVEFHFVPPNLREIAIALSTLSIPILGSNYDSSIGHSGIPDQISKTAETGIVNSSTSKISISQNSSLNIIDSSFTKRSISSIDVMQASPGQICFADISPAQVCGMQTSIYDNSLLQISRSKDNTSQIGISQVSTSQTSRFQISSTQIDTSQIKPFKVNESMIWDYFNSSKVSFPVIISNYQLLSSHLPSHNLTSDLLSDFKSNPLNLWQSFFDPTFNLTFQITDLPTGQLAEAQITQFDPQGRPNGGTILIDDDANGVGWFIDPTPLDNSEFAQTLTDTAFRATTGDAFGKYDLLTTILHETGHLLGIINGNPGFDSNVQTLNSKKVFVGKDFTANLSPDGSHLDAAVHPYDLMNNTLAPGVRKLPSLLNLQIINAIRGINTAIPQRPTNPSPQPFFLPVTSTNWKSTSYQPITPSTSTSLAPLRAILLADITNGNFNETDTTKPEYGWTTRGAATILNSQAVLTEDSPLLSNFSQSFIIPEGAKYLQFTLKNTTLGANTPTAPGDAFEVALLNANTKQSLLNTVTGLTQTDSLLNIQNDVTTITGILNPTHIYTSDGTYTASLTVTDNAGAFTIDTLTVTVNNLAPTITQLTGTTEGDNGTATQTSSATPQNAHLPINSHSPDCE